MNQYSLVVDGDYFEKVYWHLFIKEKFPSYEVFWQNYVVALTNRNKPVPDVHFKRDHELPPGSSSKDIHIAQLSYSAVLNFGRCFDIIRTFLSETKGFLEQRDLLIEGFTRLVGAQDNVFELLERKRNPIYDAFGRKCSEDARSQWKKDNKVQLEGINKTREYRNSLIHGIAFSSFFSNENPRVGWFPKVGTQDQYIDWRVTTDPASNLPKYNQAKNDFISPLDILNKSFEETLNYCENQFKIINGKFKPLYYENRTA